MKTKREDLKLLINHCSKVYCARCSYLSNCTISAELISELTRIGAMAILRQNRIYRIGFLLLGLWWVQLLLLFLFV